MKRIIFCCILVVVCFCFNHHAQQNKNLTLAEVMKILEGSTTNYNIKTIEDSNSVSDEVILNHLFPPYAGHIDNPFVQSNENSISLMDWRIDSLAQIEFNAGEEAFTNEDFAQALICYENALRIDKNLYMANLFIGDCYLQGGLPEVALEYYQKATELNPNDYRCYMFSSTAYYQLGDKAKALDCYIKALSIKPNHKTIVNILKNNQSIFQIEYMDMSFKPYAYFIKNNKTIDVFIGMSESGVWMPYILTKAMFAGESEIRAKYVSDNNSLWTLQEEKQAIIILLSGYLSIKEKGTVIDYFEKFLKIVNEGYLDIFLIYEIGALMDPDVIIKSPPEIRERTEEYLRKFIIKVE